MSKPGAIYRISISARKGEKKQNVRSALLEIGRGIVGDAHGQTARQVSLLPYESFAKLEHPDLTIHPGDFAENITTIDLDFRPIQVGTILQLGDTVQLEIIQIGKECHENCIIRETVGDCIMPREGVFARVIQPGEIAVDDSIMIVSKVPETR